MILIDAFLRFSGVGLLLFMLVLTLRDLRHSDRALYLVLICISVASHFLGFTPNYYDLPEAIHMVFRFLDIPQLYLIWLFALSLFQKDFALTTFHKAMGVFYCVPIFMERLVQFGYIEGLPGWWAWLVNLTNLFLVAHMTLVTILGRSDDLIEKRRKSRIYLVLINAFSTVCAVVFGSMLFPQYQATINVISIWPAIVWVALWLSSIDSAQLAFDKRKTIESKAMQAKDALLKDKLKVEVLENQCFLENNLSIESLAQRLGVSEYRLRAFINQKLGYSNFSSYINGYRIEAIKKAFANSENDHIPILTIAMNHGFNSLAPFNRAFKKAEGVTPSEYRQKNA